MASYLNGNPQRWVILAVIFYLATTLISTVLSGSFVISMWGEVPGQDGYSAYNITAYVLLFCVIATHLKTRSQLWRIPAAVVIMGVVVGVLLATSKSGTLLVRRDEGDVAVL